MVDFAKRMDEGQASRVYSFGPFRLEVGERRLLRDGQPIPLTGKAFDTLRLLVERAGTLQTQEWLKSSAWDRRMQEVNGLRGEGR